MARALALLLCALAATAAALSSNDGVAKVDQLSVSHVHVVAAVQQVAQELESELTGLMAQAERQRARLVAKKGINIDECVGTAIDDIMTEMVGVIDLIDSVPGIEDDLIDELTHCKGNISSYLQCRLNVLKDAITKAGQLWAKGLEHLDKIQQTVQDMLSNCLPSKPTTPAPTAEPTEGPTDEPSTDSA